MKTKCVRFSALLVLVHLLLAVPVWAVEQVIHMAPSGSDDRDGSTAASAVQSLDKALKIATSINNPKVNRVKIAVASGVYRGQTVTTTGISGGRDLIITSDDPTAGRPKFDGDGKGGTWLILQNSSGQPTNIKISGLEIANYITAISLNGNRDNKQTSNGKNEIRNNVFSNIGQIAQPGSKPSTAAIRLVNSDNNIITKNKFINIRNVEKCGLLHAIYVAHDSTDNTISDNTFQDSCGDAVRFRDRSNNNIVLNNTFIDSWDKNPVSDWYCDSTKRNDCTKSSGECPSMNNILEANRVVSKKLKPTEIFFPYGADASKLCPAKADDKRVVVK
jgi:parallel beta-helix repeat protein